MEYNADMARYVSRRGEEQLLRDALLPLWNPDFEVCGLILNDLTLFAIRNAHPHPDKAFSFCLEDLDRFIKTDKLIQRDQFGRVLGVYHTHPSNSPAPSEDDVLGHSKMTGLRSWIVTQDHITEWGMDDSGGLWARSF